MEQNLAFMHGMSIARTRVFFRPVVIGYVLSIPDDMPRNFGVSALECLRVGATQEQEKLLVSDSGEIVMRRGLHF
ncbi:hypothetical protein AGR5A_Cc170107 [Agrobacterium genomosp. 5 str. CFBP 6626]|nr:hypothetical protein AGR5A_Cc170107 [Agrobacterium genomosp. 5 str. CFBP 6626]